MSGGEAQLLAADDNRPPPGGNAVWLSTADNVRLRASIWRTGRRGTVVLFQGRTEFIEKYYEPIDCFLQRDFAVAAIDWRGQGLSDRALPDRRKGYVDDFTHFQRDVDAYLTFLNDVEAPKPWVLVAHSMGGAIAARTMMRQAPEYAGDLWSKHQTPPFSTCILSAPMLGLHGSLTGGPIGRAVSTAYVALGRGNTYTLGCNWKTSADLGFCGNVLTTDETRFASYSRLVHANPDLALGGPTWAWLQAALTEISRLSPTALPTLLAIGEKDTVVSVSAAKNFATKAQNTNLALLPDARHEPFIERETVQKRLWSEIDAFLSERDI